MNEKFQKIWLKEAYREALKSPDQSTQNGAILIGKDGYTIGRGCNEFPRNIKITGDRLERPLKYQYMVHAEANVILKSAYYGFATNNSILVCPFAACTTCAITMIQAGVKTLITHSDTYNITDKKWQDEIDRAYEMFEESGLEVIQYTGHIGIDKPIKLNTRTWIP